MSKNLYQRHENLFNSICKDTETISKPAMVQYRDFILQGLAGLGLGSFGIGKMRKAGPRAKVPNMPD